MTSQLLPTPDQVARWEAEAVQRYPNHVMHLQFTRYEYSLHFSPKDGVRVDYDLDTDFPLIPMWESLDYFWIPPERTMSDVDLTFKVYPDEQSFCSTIACSLQH